MKYRDLNLYSEGKLLSSTCNGTRNTSSTLTVCPLLAKSDGMRRPVSDGMLYAPKLSTRSKRKR